MTDVDDLKLFARLVEAGSLKVLSERTRLSLSTVSRRLAALETHLGVVLAERGPRRFALTDAGRRYHAGLVPLLQGLEALEESVTKDEQAMSGVLRLTAPVSFGERVLTSWMLELRRSHPRLELDLIWSDQFLDLAEHGIDVAVRMGALPDSGLLARRLGWLRHILVSTPEVVERAGGPPQSLEDLGRFPIVEYTQLQRPGTVEAAIGSRVARLPFTGAVRVNHVGALIEAVAAGAGVAVCPAWLVDSHIDTGRFSVLLPQVSFQSFPIHALYASHRRGSAKLRRCVDYLAKRFAEAGSAYHAECDGEDGRR